MRIVSMVPSWTETLIEAGIEVVGRTRFCIHPRDKVKSIPVVGGTKDMNWEKLRSIDFDFLLLDKEENPKEMSDAKHLVIATHVKTSTDIVVELRKLSNEFKNKRLNDFANRWETAIAELRKQRSSEIVQLQELSLEKLTNYGIRRWIKIPQQPYGQIVYVIWKNPYMAIAKETFVGSMLELVGLPTSLSVSDYKKHYPEIDLSKFDKSKTLFLFSSEPFPFHKKTSELEELDLPSAIVDGEAYSWFGVRALKFLENHLK